MASGSADGTGLPVPTLYREPALAARVARIAHSHLRLTGRALVPPSADPVGELWHAPQVIVAHGTGPDPVFFFGNAAALATFECDLADFLTMPSRLSAAPAEREARAAFMARVMRTGFVDDYSGWRISRRGRRFLIPCGTVWNLIEADGSLHGQAATFQPGPG